MNGSQGTGYIGYDGKKLVLFVVVDAFQSEEYISFGVMFFLMTNVIDHPIEIAGAKADHTVTGLSLKNFVALAELLVYFMRRCAF